MIWTPEEQEFVKSFVGIAYKDGGVSRDGVYCVGLVILFYRERGIELPDPATMDPNLVQESPFYRCFSVQHKPIYGDVVSLPGENSFDEGHVGIWTPLGILHARRGGVGVTVDRNLSRLVRRVYRHNDYV
jgi:hypothetical protein